MTNGKKTQLPVQRGSHHLPLADLTPSELDALTDSVVTLLDKFAPYMDDPGLPEALTNFLDVLNIEKLGPESSPVSEQKTHSRVRPAQIGAQRAGWPPLLTEGGGQAAPRERKNLRRTYVGRTQEGQ